MVFPRIQPDWQLSENQVTAEAVFWNRRRFIKSAVGAGLGISGAIALNSCRRPGTGQAAFEKTLGTPLQNVSKSEFTLDNPTPQKFASRFNNFYEFGQTKEIWEAAQTLPTEDWKLTVSGLVNNHKTYDPDDLLNSFPLEERTYRFRCVEAWAMVIPWIGFPMQALLQAVDPKPEAKFVRFESFYDSKITTGPSFTLSNLPWPYHEGLTIEEMNNELAFFAVGAYGKTLPKQHGAPVRMVTPWKYGFKGAKSIVKIDFVAEQPATYWNSIAPNEYGFEANVNPEKPHPRWSQATERIAGEGSQWVWKEQPTLPYNGYGEYVASLYG